MSAVSREARRVKRAEFAKHYDAPWRPWAWTRTERKTDGNAPVEYRYPSKMAPLSWLETITMAVVAKAMSVGLRYRGHLPQGLGSRAQARSEGFTDARHKARVMAERQAKVEQARKEFEERLEAQRLIDAARAPEQQPT